MRCARIEFKGYRRLADAATSIDGRITAFVGFNEAGKTTLLRGLEWFSEDDTELAVTDRNRSRPPHGDDSPIVKVFFDLEPGDRQAIAQIACDQVPTSLNLTRRRNGERVYFMTPTPGRPAKPFEVALTRLTAARTTLAAEFEDAASEDDEDPDDWADTVEDALARKDVVWSEAQRNALGNLILWFDAVPEGKRSPRNLKLARHLEAVDELVALPLPMTQMWNVLSKRMPEFVLFGEENREIETTYELNPQSRDLPPAVDDLLTIAGVDPDDLWTHLANQDSSSRETLLERGNERLRDLFSEAWNQSGITVRLNVTSTRLEIMVRELHDGGAVTNISERSDGLKTFVALSAFLAAGNYAVPPILLIDEAETHLHYDAQADLVGVLLKSINATQVFYTTHSPGCLPSDLGTGIRVISRDDTYGDASVIKSNFWEGNGPGFSPLLFAMGAGAAAFSMCRQAVLAEGASDMVLLPSLIRLATGLPDLEYQVAQGLANAHTSGIRVEEVAAKVVYLTDGDAGGDKHVEDLLEATVHKSRIFQLPPGMAAEDLIPVEDYCEIVNGFLEKMHQSARFQPSDAIAGQPIAKTFADWAKKNECRTPGKVEVAYAILDLPDLRLTTAGKRTLSGLHRKFEKAFSATEPTNHTPG